MTITPAVVCKLIDPTAVSYEFAPGRWSVWGDNGQPLAMDAGHLDGIDYDFPTESEAWLAAYRFLAGRASLTPLTTLVAPNSPAWPRSATEALAPRIRHPQANIRRR